METPIAQANVFEELSWRGLVHQTTSPELQQILSEQRITCYIGFDPSADSLHVGHLLQALLLVRMQRAGHRPIALIGGGTGMIGDPSGKSEERNLLDAEHLAHNQRGVQAQLQRLLAAFGPSDAVLVNNASWLQSLSLLEFLRDIGKHFSVGAMMERDAVRTRLQQRDGGISFTEFSYGLLQAYDFLHLFDTHGCILQLGGSDQWGNLTSGVDLIRRKRGARAFGMTSPLLTTADGKKLGKTETGAVWLDASKTSPYQFYQYWIRTDDRDVCKLLRMLTMRDQQDILELEKKTNDAPHLRQAQAALASDMTTLVHGSQAAADAVRASAALFGQEISTLDEAALLDVMSEAPSLQMSADDLSQGMSLVDLVVRTQLCTSKSAARKDIAAGAIYINNERTQQVDHTVKLDDTLLGKYLVLRKGKKNFFLIKLVN